MLNSDQFGEGLFSGKPYEDTTDNDTYHRASYHLNRKDTTPPHLQVKPGEVYHYRSRPVIPDPDFDDDDLPWIGEGKPPSLTRVGTLIGSERGMPQHPNERANYPVPKGQMVMGPPHNPQQFGELDAHGNVLDRGNISGRWFKKHGPQMSDNNEAFWDKHAKFQHISTSAVLHTGQSDDQTGTHSYITGPLAPDHPHVKVVVQGGTPYIADGHHRLAEVRGRGDTHIGAQVLNLDQFTPRPEEYIGKRTPPEDIADHMVKGHDFSPQHINLKRAHEDHEYEHRMGLHDHEHG
jgi:hypothetical protein